MTRSEYSANVSLTRAAPASWMRPAPVRATRAATCNRFMGILLGVSALSIVAFITIVLQGAI